MHVGINTTGHHVAAGCVEDLVKVSRCLYLHIRSVHSLDFITLNDDIGLELAIRVHDGTILDKDGGTEGTG